MDAKPSLGEHPGLVVSILCTSVAAGAYEIVPSSTAPLLADQLGATPVQVSWLVSVMLGVAVVGSLPAGAIVDRFGVLGSVALATAVFVVGGAVSWYFAARGAYWPVLWSRAVAGFGFVLLWNTGLTAVGQFRNAATATGLYTASGPGGFALGHVTGPAIATAFAPQAVFLVYPLLLVPATVGVAAFWPADLERGGSGELPSAGEFAAVARNRSVLLVCLLGFVSYSLYLFVNSWVPTYLNSRLTLSLAESGALTALFPLLGAASRASGGVVTDRLFAGRARPVVVVSLVASGVALTGVMLSSTYLLLAGFLLVGGYFVQLSLGVFYGVVPATVDDDHVTTAVALLTSVGLFGAFTAPLLAGEAIQATGSYTAAFGYGLALTAVGLVVAVRWFDL
ncbi:MFS transporter [Halobaculum sp. P14]|uniref:MFS transporter n=1 Tax=Halobaculum sp. P14 TaxID=3421638 RepID=UPI003EBC9E9F